MVQVGHLVEHLVLEVVRLLRNIVDARLCLDPRECLRQPPALTLSKSPPPGQSEGLQSPW